MRSSPASPPPPVPRTQDGLPPRASAHWRISSWSVVVLAPRPPPDERPPPLDLLPPPRLEDEEDDRPLRVLAAMANLLQRGRGLRPRGESSCRVAPLVAGSAFRGVAGSGEDAARRGSVTPDVSRTHASRAAYLYFVGDSM